MHTLTSNLSTHCLNLICCLGILKGIALLLDIPFPIENNHFLLQIVKLIDSNFQDFNESTLLTILTATFLRGVTSIYPEVYLCLFTRYELSHLFQFSNSKIQTSIWNCIQLMEESMISDDEIEISKSLRINLLAFTNIILSHQYQDIPEINKVIVLGEVISYNKELHELIVPRVSQEIEIQLILSKVQDWLQSYQT